MATKKRGNDINIRRAFPIEAKYVRRCSPVCKFSVTVKYFLFCPIRDGTFCELFRNEKIR